MRLVHQRVHTGWAEGYIRLSPYKVLGPATSKRVAEVSLVIRWDGTVDKAEITRSSGADDFDAAALNAIWLAAPFPPPVDVMADDGLVHLKWQFARDYRLCSGAEMAHVEYPLQLALPSLASRGQLSEAVRRMREQLAREGWTRDFLSPFIRQWLARSTLTTELDARAAAALALGGDRQQARVLQGMLVGVQTAPIAAPALERLGVDLAGLMAKTLSTAGDDLDAVRPAVLAAIRSAPAVLSRCPTCVNLMAAAVLDRRQPVRARVEMIGLLGGLERTEALEQTLVQATKDTNAGIRGAALLAQMPAGRGRVGVIRMSALLRDPAPELRAAGAAGVLRAGGDGGIEQLYLLTRDRDSRPLIAAAAELGRLSSAESADLLRRLLKRPEKPVRVAVVSALAGRRDAAARELVEPILRDARTNQSEEPAIRQLAMVGASTSDLVAMGEDARMGLAPYRALLAAQLRLEAARWLLDHVERLSPEDRIIAMGDWIAEAPKLATAATQQ